MSLKTFAPFVLFLISACGSTPQQASAPAASAAPTSEAEPKAVVPEDTAKQAEKAAAPATPEPEATCTKDADCTIFADCCSCKAVSAKVPLPPSCEGICGESKCEVKGKTLANVSCVAGHCKLK